MDSELNEFEAYLKEYSKTKVASTDNKPLKDRIKSLLMKGVAITVILTSLATYFSPVEMQEWKQEVESIKQEVVQEQEQEVVAEPVSQELDREILFRQLKKHEGDREYSYDDSKGFRTIGIGFNMDRAGAREFAKSLLGITDSEWIALYGGRAKLNGEQINLLLEKDIDDSIEDAKRFMPSYDNQPRVVKHIIVDMIFNMGLNKLNGFKNLKAALENYDYKTAAAEMEDSDWFEQTGNRSATLINLMLRYADLADGRDDHEVRENMDKMFDGYFK